MMKTHLVEGVVPVIIELKRGMEAARHPLLGDLMAATGAMLKDYKNEVRAPVGLAGTARARTAGQPLAKHQEHLMERLHELRFCVASGASAVC